MGWAVIYYRPAHAESQIQYQPGCRLSISLWPVFEVDRGRRDMHVLQARICIRNEQFLRRCCSRILPFARRPQQTIVAKCCWLGRYDQVEMYHATVATTWHKKCVPRISYGCVLFGHNDSPLTAGTPLFEAGFLFAPTTPEKNSCDKACSANQSSAERWKSC
jgi:hypothetical protein